jgi:hypothetical protein
MKPQTADQKQPFWAILCLSALTAIAAFGIAYRQDQKSISQATQLALGHLIYALQMKDDMAVIDWEHELETTGGWLGFQVSTGSKVIAEGGNRNVLTPRPDAAGLSYRFPDQWILLWRSGGPPATQAEVVACCRSWPGPVLWGLMGFAGCFLSGMTASWRTTHGWKGSPVPPAGAARVPPVPFPTTELQGPEKTTGPAESPFLMLDKNFIIQQISPQAADLFGKESSELIQSHLLDLLPDPKLMRSIEKGERTKLSDAFPRHPDISVVLEPEPTGTLLHFFPSEPPKNA